MNCVLRPFSPSNLDTLSQFAERLNARRETGSTFCYAEAPAIRRDFTETMPYGFACWENDIPVGLISCFPDFAKKNADCSLLSDAEGTAYQLLASQLVDAARKALGPDMACTFFFPMENKECSRFLRQAGARQQINEYIMLLKKEGWHASVPATLPCPLQAGEHAAFIALHDAVFPEAYACGRDILKDLGQTRFVYVLSDDIGLAAYGVLQFHGGAQATAEMIGVRKDIRHRGYGRAILNHLASQAFGSFGADALKLVVDADNENALGLYRSAGFCVRQENHCYILEPLLTVPHTV